MIFVGCRKTLFIAAVGGENYIDLDATNSDTGQFMLLWSRAENGGFSLPVYTEFEVGNRTITVTALK